MITSFKNFMDHYNLQYNVPSSPLLATNLWNALCIFVHVKDLELLDAVGELLGFPFPVHLILILVLPLNLKQKRIFSIERLAHGFYKFMTGLPCFILKGRLYIPFSMRT